MSIVAIPWFDHKNGVVPTGTRTQSGWRGSDPYRINTVDRDLALAASGLPAEGTEHPAHPGSYCVSLEWDPVGGGGSASNAGWSIVRAVFEPLTPAQFDLVYEDGDAYSELVFSDGSFAARFDAAGAAIPETQVEAYRAELVVHRYATTPAVALSFLQSVTKVNSNAFNVPPLFGVGGPIAIAPREVLVRSPQIALARPGLLRIALRFGFGIANWHRLAYRKELADGTPTGPVINSDLYQAAALPVASWWTA